MTAIEELHAQRADLVSKKAKITESIVAINQRLVVTLPHVEYARAIGMKNELVKQLQLIEGQLTAINSRRHSANLADEQAKGNANVPHVRQLVELRDSYQVFAADATRSPTMRRMASEFVVKLTPIIRQALGKRGALE